MPSRAIIEIVVKSGEAKEVIKGLQTQLDGLGISVTGVREKATASEAAFERLERRLDPAAAAAKRLADAQAALKWGLDNGKISAEKYTQQLGVLNDQFAAQATGGNRLIDQLKGMVAGYLGVAGAMLAVKKGFDWIGETVNQAAEAEVAQVRLEAMVKATGNAAGLTGEQLSSMATQMQMMTGASDESVKAAQAVLLTFTNIRGQAFEPVLKVAADLAAVLGTDLSSATRMVGVALESPAQGMDRLRRAGVVLSETVKEQIKTLQEHGDLVGAQNLLLGELQARVGGVAEAMGGTYKQSLEAAKQAWGDVREEVGAFITEANGGTSSVKMFADALEVAARNVKALREAGIGDLFGLGGFGAVGGAYGAMTAQAQPYIDAINQAFEHFRSAGASGAAVGPFATEEQMAKAVKDTEEVTKAALDAIKKETDAFLKRSRAELKEPSLVGMMLFGGDMGMASFAGQFSEQIGKPAADALLAGISRGFGMHSDQVNSMGLSFGRDFGVAAGHEVPGGIVSGLKEGIAISGGGVDKDLAQQFGKSFSDGFIAFMQGDDFSSMWKALWGGLAGMASNALGTTISGLLSGKQLTGSEGALAGAGLWGQNGFNWQGGIAMGGGLVAGYGAQTGNTSAGILGGAVSGAATGASFGWVGAIVGAVVGGVMGYFASSGGNAQGYHAYIDAQGVSSHGKAYSGTGVALGGSSADQAAEQGRQLVGAYTKYNSMFRNLLTLMDQSFVDMSKFSFDIHGETGDVGSMWQQILTGNLPRAVFQQYKPTLQTGLQGMGISEGRAGALLDMFNSRTFEDAAAALGDYLTALTRLQDLQKDLAKSTTELHDTLTMSVRAAWEDASNTSLEEIAKLSRGLDQLTNDEQVARAQQIADLAEQQYQSNLQFLKQIIQVQDSLNASFGQTFTGFREQQAAEVGPYQQRDFYVSQLADLQRQLKSAMSPEMVQTITQQMLQYASKLWGLNLGGMPGDKNAVGSREWVETYLKQQQDAANAMLSQWQDEVTAANGALLDATGAITDALTGTGVMLDNLSQSLADSIAAHSRLGGALGDARNAVNDFTGAIIDALNQIGDAQYGGGNGDLGGGGYRRGA